MTIHTCYVVIKPFTRKHLHIDGSGGRHLRDRNSAIWRAKYNCLNVTKIRVGKAGRRSTNGKQAAQKFDGERFNFTKLNELEVRKHQIEITNRFVALENLSDREDINRAWENIKDYIKPSARQSRSAWSEAEYTMVRWMFRYFRSREEAKMQWIHDTSQSNVDNLTNVKREINRHFRNIKEYLKDEIE